MLKAVGMTKQDREAILELLMDVSGATNYVDDAVGLLKNLDFFGLYLLLLFLSKLFILFRNG